MTVFVLISFPLFPKLTIAAIDPASCVVVIESIELKNSSGQWITVASPDHPVDVVAQEPGFSFFNNGKVPPGRYVNFRINLSERFKVFILNGKNFRPVPVKFKKSVSGEKIEIYGTQDFDEPLVVNKGSFIGVWFKLDFHGTIHQAANSVYFMPPDKIDRVTVTVDEKTKVLECEKIAVSF